MTQGPNHENIRTLLTPGEPGPFRVLNPVSSRPILLVCDHASDRFPRILGDLGLDPFARRCHLAIDIGAGALTERIAERLGVTAVLQNYSRLVVDCNRELMDPGAFLEYGDGIVVPGNRNLHKADKDLRASALYWPYHAAIAAQVERLTRLGTPPVFISVHSFTPVLNGESRPWQVGILWDKDEAMRQIFLDGFRAAGYVVGDNEPYSGKAPQDYTIDNHAEANGLSHVGIEIRQDQVGHDVGVEEIADVMAGIIAAVPERLGMRAARIRA